MRLPLPSTLKRIQRRVFSPNTRLCVAIVAAVLVLEAIIFIGTFPAEPDPALPEVPSGSNDIRIRPIFSISEIEGIDTVMTAVQAGAEAPANPLVVKAAVLPHHTVPASKLMELWKEIEVGSDPSVIVVIGPNHENAGEGMVQTTRGVWTSPYGNVETDDGLVDRLVSLGIATDEPDSFVNEHAIGTHVSFMANLFPGVPMVPIIAKSPAGADDALSLALVLQQILPDDALVVSSVDFCHFLPQDVTDAMDSETLALITARRYAEIERLHSDHVDTPYALMAYLLWSDRNGFVPDLIWHETSHRLLGDPNAPGTSYLAFFSASPQPSSASQSSLTLSFVGDLMLGRGVAGWLAKTTVPEAFGSAADALAGSDVVFGNLESVLTSSATPSGKEIYFHADPARIDVLRYLGFTHVSVTNNHVDDYGRAGWDDSIAHLNDAGIFPVGDYYNQSEPVIDETNDRRVVFLAYDDLYRPIDKNWLAGEVAAADALGDILVVSFHWGNEYEHDPTQRQKDLAHAAVDAGADIVVGHHPHVLQGVETYNGGLILYSLGNFIFDQFGEDENESLVVKISFGPSLRDGLVTAEFVPMRIIGGFPCEATSEERRATLERIAEWSAMSDSGSFVTDGIIRW